MQTRVSEALCDLTPNYPPRAQVPVTTVGFVRHGYFVVGGQPLKVHESEGKLRIELTETRCMKKRSNLDVVRRYLPVDTARNLVSCPVLNRNHGGLAQFRVLTSKFVLTQMRVDGRQEVIHLKV
jgi:hypothetical protein